MTIDQQLDPKALAARLSVTEGYLAKMRLTGDGPRFTKLGRAVRYDPGDVQAWLNARKANSTSEKLAA